MSLLPVFLKLEGRTGLVVGAGTVAFEKINSLLKTGLRLRVVAPLARQKIRQLAMEGKLEWIERRFEIADLDGIDLVIAATDSAEVNAQVYREAVERRILANSVDDPPHCDFYFGSVVSRGALQIAISTAGESPAVAQRLRREIVEQLPRTTTGKLLRAVLRTQTPTTPVWQLSLGTAPPDTDVATVTRPAPWSEADNEQTSAVTLSGRLDALQRERYRLVADAVRAEVANMLGQPGHQSVNPDVALSEQGFDSQMAVELRNRLSTATGLRLPDTIVWDYSSASGLARYLEAELSERGRPAEQPMVRSQVGVDEPAAIGGVDEPVAVVGWGGRERPAHE